MTAELHTILAVFAFLVGACVGSFINVCAYRIPREMSVSEPPSYCTACGEPIRWFHNIPLVSWWWLRGRAACCGAAFSIRYWLVELTTAVLFAWLFLKFGLPLAPIYALFVSLLLIGLLTDLDFYIIPDRVTWGSVALGLAFSAWVPLMHDTFSIETSLIRAVTGAAVGGGLMWFLSIAGSVLLKQEALGFGDVKLMAGVGAFLGWQAVAFTLTLGSLLGSIGGIALMLAQGKRFGSMTPIPFGPPLMASAIFWILAGKEWAQRHYGPLLFPL